MARVSALGLVSALGGSVEDHLLAVREPLTHKLTLTDEYTNNGALLVGKVTSELPVVPSEFWPFTARFFSLALAAAQQVAPTVNALIERYGAHRVGVVMGSSTSGIHSGEAAYVERAKSGIFPEHYHYAQQEMGALSKFLSGYFGVTGCQYTISTACTSGAKALLSAKRLIDLGQCDAVITGGVDSLCALTIRGFSSLGLVSKRRANPFSVNRDGLNIGEGAAIVVLERECRGSQRDAQASSDNSIGKYPIVLAAGGESSDAHHVSAPHPQGRGAKVAIAQAIKRAGINAGSIGYVNAHGTGTLLNDAAEAEALSELCAEGVPFSSTKSSTGHTLGAAGAIEAALCILLLQQATDSVALPVHFWDGEEDDRIPKVNLVEPGQSARFNLSPYALSTSFAFGGSNCALLFQRVLI
jgi:3-oxoacyl-[acyl-carrier-protein] synthase I